MKYLNKFNENITPNTVLNKRGSSEISSSKFDQLLNTQCKSYSDKNIKILRGQSYMGDHLYFDPTKGEKRRSIEPTNVHVDLIDLLPSWKGYPKYSKSVIGKTIDVPINYKNSSEVRGYGSPYEVIPFENSEIVICPSTDIWDSFGSDGWGSDIRFVDNIFSELFMLNGSISKKDLEDLKTSDEYIHSHIDEESELLENISEYMNRDSESDTFYKPCKNTNGWKDRNSEDIRFSDVYNYINDCLFNPEVRGFKHLYYEDLRPPFEVSRSIFDLSNKQIWTSGPVIMRKVHS
jgi:hypothetical protein